MNSFCLRLAEGQITFSLLWILALVFSLEKDAGASELLRNKHFAQATIAQKAQEPKKSGTISIKNDLIIAISKGDTVAVKKIIESGANLSEKDEKGMTPLMYAAFNGQRNAEILRLLLKSGADVNAREQNGATALIISMNPGGSREGVLALLEHGANVNISTLDGQTPLMWACNWYDADIVKALLEKGAEINARRDDGATVLHIAAKFYRSKTVKLLLENGADPLLKTKAGETPLMLAQERLTSEKQSMNKSVKSQLITVIRDLKSAESKRKNI